MTGRVFWTFCNAAMKHNIHYRTSRMWIMRSIPNERQEDEESTKGKRQGGELEWTPVWSRYGGICTGESNKSIVKFTFFKSAFLNDAAKPFNSSLEGNVRRAIDLFKALICAAVALNTSSLKKCTKRK